jgi:NAD(P)-dependent dehydrogenase (short-subunit alcohol dehydrogenase family)
VTAFTTPPTVARDLMKLFPITLLAVTAVSMGLCAQATPAEPKAQRAVLVTGASSGIGRKTAELLAQNGFHVYATARKDDDLKALAAIPNVQALRLDVTSPEQIDAAVKTVQEGGRGLYGLINNAGVAVLAPLIEVSEKDLAFQFDANVYGPYRLTKAFAPLLIASKGRVLTTGSISGIVTWAMGGPYTMSKHAVEAFTDTLALEMQPFGVHVGVVEPGNYRSEIMTNMRERLAKGGYGGEGSRYQKQLDRLLTQPTDRGQYKEPDEVAAAFLQALTDTSPKRRYMVVPNQREAEMAIRAAVARVVQLNADQPYTYDRAALIKLLDEELQKK